MIRMLRALTAVSALLMMPPALAAVRADPPARDYTMDRLTLEAMEQLVAEPMARIASGDVSGAQQLFERMLARARSVHGRNSVQEADLLLSFGAMMHAAGDDAEDPRLRALGGTYAARAVPAYRAAFGADHPEVAIALNSHADILRLAAPDDPPVEAERDMEEAYRIRLAALGPGHSETIWTMLYLADIRAAPARVRRNPALVDAAAAELERAAALAEASAADRDAQFPSQIHLRRARLFARFGRGDDARNAIEAARQAARGGDPVDTCLMIAWVESEIAELLEGTAEGEEAAAAADVLECLEEPARAPVASAGLQSAMATVLSSV
jgi:hypothetical protein